MRFIQFFGHDKEELCGTSAYWVTDQRKSVRTMIQAALHYPSKEDRFGYFRIAYAARLSDKNYHYLTNFIAL